VILDANGPTLVVADEVDENGVIEFALLNSSAKLVYAALTVNQAEVLARHLLALVGSTGKREVRRLAKVRIMQTGHTDLLGGVGVVTDVTPSGNLQVLVGNEYVTLTPSSVEVIE
jgi:hypothetical protein